MTSRQNVICSLVLSGLTLLCPEAQIPDVCSGLRKKTYSVGRAGSLRKCMSKGDSKRPARRVDREWLTTKTLSRNTEQSRNVRGRQMPAQDLPTPTLALCILYIPHTTNRLRSRKSATAYSLHSHIQGCKLLWKLWCVLAFPFSS